MTRPDESGEYVHPELKDQTDGALRVARRKALYSLKNAIEIRERLDLEEHGEYNRPNTIGNHQGSIAACSDMMAKDIADELDRRGADYKTRGEVMG